MLPKGYFVHFWAYFWFIWVVWMNCNTNVIKWWAIMFCGIVAQLLHSHERDDKIHSEVPNIEHLLTTLKTKVFGRFQNFPNSFGRFGLKKIRLTLTKSSQMAWNRRIWSHWISAPSPSALGKTIQKLTFMKPVRDLNLTRPTKAFKVSK